jgi:hypothetical protein
MSAERAAFLSQFNHHSAEEVFDHAYGEATQIAVKGELRFPETAAFAQIYVRKCQDNIVRTAGTVSCTGVDGAAFDSGYLVEFTNGSCRLLEIRPGFDPVTLKELPKPQAWDGTSIPYARQGIAGPKLPFDWGLAIKLGVMALILALVVFLVLSN